jgi:hypothetical protein
MTGKFPERLVGEKIDKIQINQKEWHQATKPLQLQNSYTSITIKIS